MRNKRTYLPNTQPMTENETETRTTAETMNHIAGAFLLLIPLLVFLDSGAIIAAGAMSVAVLWSLILAASPTVERVSKKYTIELFIITGILIAIGLYDIWMVSR